MGSWESRPPGRRGCYPARAGGPWLRRTLVLFLFHAVVVPSGLTTRVQPALNDDLVVEGAQEHAALYRGLPAVGLVRRMVHRPGAGRTGVPARATSAARGEKTSTRRAAPNCWSRSGTPRNGAKKPATTTPTGTSTEPIGWISGSAPKTASAPLGGNMTGCTRSS